MGSKPVCCRLQSRCHSPAAPPAEGGRIAQGPITNVPVTFAPWVILERVFLWFVFKFYWKMVKACGLYKASTTLNLWRFPLSPLKWPISVNVPLFSSGRRPGHETQSQHGGGWPWGKLFNFFDHKFCVCKWGQGFCGDKMWPWIDQGLNTWSTWINVGHSCFSSAFMSCCFGRVIGMNEAFTGIQK